MDLYDVLKDTLDIVKAYFGKPNEQKIVVLLI